MDSVEAVDASQIGIIAKDILFHLLLRELRRVAFHELEGLGDDFIDRLCRFLAAMITDKWRERVSSRLVSAQGQVVGENIELVGSIVDEL